MSLDTGAIVDGPAPSAPPPAAVPTPTRTSSAPPPAPAAQPEPVATHLPKIVEPTPVATPVEQPSRSTSFSADVSPNVIHIYLLRVRC